MTTLTTTTTTNAIPSFDLDGKLPILADATSANYELMSEYWTPKKEGESVRCFFQRIEDSNYENQETGEVVELPCAILLSQNAKGEIKTIRNGSKRLVASIKSALEKGIIMPGSPLLITYLGKVKNVTNQHSSDGWSIVPLIFNS